MDLSRKKDLVVGPALLDATEINPRVRISARQALSDPTITEDSSATEPDVIQRDNANHRQPSSPDPSPWLDMKVRGNSTAHFGNNYQVINHYGRHSAYGNCWLDKKRPVGIHFDLSTPNGDTVHDSAFDDASKKLLLYKSKKRQAIPPLVDHQEAYKAYTEVQSPKLRSCLVQIARSFMDLDELFAAMFFHIIQASNYSTLSERMNEIRHEISVRQTTEPVTKGDKSAYLGDLGQHCEELLRRYERAKQRPDDDAGSIPEFRTRNGSDQSLIDYLEDGFEIPYWKLMLDAFSTSRLNKTTLGGDLIAMGLFNMRSKVYDMRQQLGEVLDGLPEKEIIGAIVKVIDKRINLLRSFTDRTIYDRKADRDEALIALPLSMAKGSGEPGDVTANADSDPPDAAERFARSQPLLLVTLVLLTMIAATVPFAQGFKASNETGTTSDADFWLNISSSIFTIMANSVMIIQLTEGSRFSKRYMYVWIWFFLGILCASISVAIYPFCNTAWSSLMSFFATIAGFGATLSVAMTIGTTRSDAAILKKKTD